MKQSLIRFGAPFAVEVAVFVGAVWWRDATYSGWAIGQVLFWPAIELARLGLHPTWPVLPLLALLLPAVAVVAGRKRHFGAVGLVAALLASLWCGAGARNTRRLANLVPGRNPYPAGSTNAAAFESADGNGYAEAATGRVMTHCFSPEDETAGHYQGQMEGSVIMNRVLGRPEDRDWWWLRRSAQWDGVNPPFSPAPAR
jgi:hypothetical protein